MKKEENNCNGCPCHVVTYDYWGECDEWCEIHRIYKKCYYSLLIRKLLKHVWKIREAYYEWCADRNFKKQAKEEYEERMKLGMTEDEYCQLQYDEMMKQS